MMKVTNFVKFVITLQKMRNYEIWHFIIFNEKSCFDIYNHMTKKCDFVLNSNTF